MAAIDAPALRKLMDRAPITRKKMAEELGLSLQYVCDIADGRRNLKRNPELRQQIARLLDVPAHWIEHRDEVAS